LVYDYTLAINFDIYFDHSMENNGP
jgi:hypothetical protein